MIRMKRKTHTVAISDDGAAYGYILEAHISDAGEWNIFLKIPVGSGHGDREFADLPQRRN